MKQLFNLYSVFRPLNFLDQLELKKFIRTARAAGNRKAKKNKIIPSSSNFIGAVKKFDRMNKGKIALLLILMISSGRRAIDIMRINSSQVTYLGHYKYKIFIPFDKKNDHEIRFIADLEAIPPIYRPTSLENLDSALKAEFNSDLYPFKSCSNKNISRMLNFHPHSIRSLVAIYLTSLGLDDDRIKSVAGWKDQRSLVLYRRLERFEIEGRELGILINMANSR